MARIIDGATTIRRALSTTRRDAEDGSFAWSRDECFTERQNMPIHPGLPRVLTVSIAFTLIAGTAAAQQVQPAPVFIVVAPRPRPVDGVRFRGAVSLAGGGEFIMSPGGTQSFSGGLGGVDGRMGVQINNLLAVYFQPHLSFGVIRTASGSGGATGTLAATVLLDVTLAHRFFVGAGAGYGVLNAPNGPVVQLRFGGYPLAVMSDDSPTRRGLMVGADARMYFTPAGTAVQLMLGLGYEVY